MFVMKNALATAGILAAFGLAATSATAQPRGAAPRLATGSSTMVVSPVAVATWVARHEGRGMADAVELVVIWRGAARWFAHSGPRSGSGGGSGSTFSASQTYGDITVDLQFDFDTRVARVNGRTVNVGSANVILVDDVDRAGRSRVVGTLTVDGTAPTLPLIAPVLARSPEIVAFLQCDRTWEPAAPEAGLCDPILHPVDDTSAAAEGQVRAALGRYAAMVLAGNHAGVAALFAPDGELVNPGQDPVSGRAAIQAFLAGLAEYHVLQFNITGSKTEVHGDAATQVAGYVQRARGPDGKILEVSGRFTAEWRRDPSGAWQITRMTTASGAGG